MPLDFTDGAGGFDFSRFTSGVSPRLPDGAVENTRTNAILSQWFTELENDGAPLGWNRSHIPVDEGYDVYIGATRETMTKHNVTPINPEDDAYQFNSPVVGGASPPTRSTPDVAVLETDPDDPTVKKVAATDVGYPQGVYLAAKTKIGKSGKTHTNLSSKAVCIVDTDGKSLEWQAATDLEDECWGEGLWLSKPVSIAAYNNGLGTLPDPSTMRLQEKRRKGPRTYTTNGPLKLGTYARKPPTRNETKVGTPQRLKRARDFPIRGGFPRDLQAMRAQFAIVVTTALGESVNSPLSDAVEIKKEREHHAFVFSPERLHPDATGYKIFCLLDNVVNPPWYQLIRVHRGEKTGRFGLREKPVLYGYIDSGDGSTAVPHMPAEIDPEPKDPIGQTTLNGAINATTTSVTVASHSGFPNSASGWSVKCGHEVMKVTGGGLTNNWTVQRGVQGTKAEAHADGAAVIENQEPAKKEKRDREPHRLSYILIAADPPVEDTTGIEDPTGDIDAPTPIGIGRPGVGTWWVCYNRRFDGNPTQSSKPVKVTITGSQVIELRFPPRVNKLFNALYGQLNQKGLPSGWTFYKKDATLYTATDANISISAGQVGLSTGGQVTTNDRYPQALSYDASDPLNTLIPATPGRLERLRATLQVTNYNTRGRGYIELVQYDSDGTTQLGSPISLGTLAQNGYLYVNKTIGKASLSPDIPLYEDATTGKSASYLALRWGAENTTVSSITGRNLTVSAYSLFLHPFNGEPRAFEERSTPDELWQPSIDPATPIKGSHELTFGPPPGTPDDIAAVSPLDTVDHSTGTFSVGSGNLPTNWTVNRSATNANNEATIAATTVFTGSSQNAAKFRSDDTINSNNNYFERDYTGTYSGTSLAEKAKIYIERLPNKSGSYLFCCNILSGSSLAMGRLRLSDSGSLRLYSRDKNSNEKSVILTSGLRVGDIVEVDFLISGGNTTSGNISTSIGVNGAVRSVGPTLSGINWTGHNPRIVRYGGFSESRSDMTWTLWFDDVVPTPTGYPISLPPPASGTTPTTDRPKDSLGNFREKVTSNGETFKINQGYGFFLSSDVLSNTEMGHVVEEYFVFPETTRTAAVFLKPNSFPTGMRVFVLAAYNDAGDRVELGCLSEQTGSNAVANATTGWYEYWMTYSAPEGYYRIRWEHEGTTGGSYVYQEPLDAAGTLSTASGRDAARVEARSASGVFSVLLQARIPEQADTEMAGQWNEERRSLNVVSEIPDALTSSAVTYRARATDISPPTSGWSAWQTDLSLVPDYEWIEVEVTLTSDGTNTAVIPTGGVNVNYSCFQPVLLREDRTALPGGCYIGGDSGTNLSAPYTLHEYDEDAPGGIALARAITERINRLDPYAVTFFSRDGVNEVRKNQLARDENGIPVVTNWCIESPDEDLVMKVRFYGVSGFAPSFDYERLQESLHFWVPKVMSVESTQVLEAGPLT